MIFKELSDVALEPVREGIGIRWVLAARDGAPNFAMRVIELDPGVVFEPHHHPYEHEIFVLEGQGVATTPEGDAGEMKSGTFLYIAPDEKHGYRNTGDRALRFICVIPNQE